MASGPDDQATVGTTQHPRKLGPGLGAKTRQTRAELVEPEDQRVAGEAMPTLERQLDGLLGPRDPKSHDRRSGLRNAPVGSPLLTSQRDGDRLGCASAGRAPQGAGQRLPGAREGCLDLDRVLVDVGELGAEAQSASPSGSSSSERTRARNWAPSAP